MNYNEFLERTEDPYKYTILDVPGDNHCFYHSCVLALLHKANFNNIDTPQDFIYSTDFTHQNTEEEVYLLDLDDEYLTHSMLLLETRITEWIHKNSTEIFTQIGLDIATMVQITHGISFEEYIGRDIIQSNLWGGLVEQIAFCNLYGLNLTMYRPVSYNKRYKRINEGVVHITQKANKNVRFQIVQEIEPFTSSTDTIYLLWKRYNGCIDHYMALLNNLSNVSSSNDK
jgi:hypothetical protein